MIPAPNHPQGPSGLWGITLYSVSPVTNSIEIRESVPDDSAGIELLYPEAFPDEDLLPLVKALSKEAPTVLSLVGIIDSRLVGHIMLTKCGVVGARGIVALLGPLAVMPAWQSQGIGTAIVRAGLRRLKDAGVSQVYVLGDPALYFVGGMDRGMAVEELGQCRTPLEREALPTVDMAPAGLVDTVNRQRVSGFLVRRRLTFSTRTHRRSVAQGI